MLKQCITCGILKDIEEFYKNKTRKDGHSDDCKECHKTLTRKHHKVHKGEIHKQQKEYREKHKEETKKRDKKYKKSHKEEIQKRNKKYYKSEQGKAAICRAHHNRRALTSNLKATLTIVQWQYILKKQNNRCNVCGKKFTAKRSATQDHIIPVKHNGNYSSDNIRALCKSCNCRKNATLDKQYIQTWNM